MHFYIFSATHLIIMSMEGSSIKTEHREQDDLQKTPE
jgi:hypothetical protein